MKYLLIILAANINPFTPPGISLRKKRARLDGEFNLNSSLPVMSNPIRQINNINNNRWQPQPYHSVPTTKEKDLQSTSLGFELSYDEELNEFRQAPKRLALQDSNITRYEKEFVELKLLGVGEFGLVYQCLNRLDGVIYVVKRSV